MASSLWWVAVAGLLIVSVVTPGGNGSLLFLDVMLALAGLATWVWGRYALAGVGYSRLFGRSAAAETRLAFGEETDVWLEVVNAKPLPLAWLRIDDEFPTEMSVISGALPPTSQHRRRPITHLLSVRWYERVRRHYRLRGDRRGVSVFGPARLTSGDVFGIRTCARELDLVQRVIVHPKIVPLAELGLAHARPFGDFKAPRRVQPDPLRLAGARPYAPGDNPRHIHWKATARRAALQTKIFDPGAAPHLVMLLNAQTTEFLYEGIIPEYLEKSAVAAASVASAAQEARIPIGLATNGVILDHPGRVRLPASRHSAHLTHLLDTLSRLTYFILMPFQDLIRLEASSLPYGANVVAISPVVSDPILSSLLGLCAAGHPTTLLTVGDGPYQASPPEIPTHELRIEIQELRSATVETNVF